MDEFDAIQQAVDAAIKHARHNQKTHGQRGGNGGDVASMAIRIGKATGRNPSGRNRTGAAATSAPAAPATPAPPPPPVAAAVPNPPKKRSSSAAVPILGTPPAPTEDPWASGAYKPSKAAMEVVNKFAAMKDDPNGTMAIIDKLKAQGSVVARLSAEHKAAQIESYTNRTTENALRAANLQAKLSAAEKEFNRLGKLNVDRDVHPLLQVSPGRNITSTTDSPLIPGRKLADPNSLNDIIAKGSDAFTSMIASRDPLNGFTQPFIPRAGIRSGYFMLHQKIALGERRAATVVHEMAHAMELRNPKVLQRAVQFLDQRTKGEPTLPMSVLSKRAYNVEINYKPTEIGQADKFIEPYVGKRYPQRVGTEVLSMGMEYMMTDPVGFAKRDPEHFAFVLDVIRTPSLFESP